MKSPVVPVFRSTPGGNKPLALACLLMAGLLGACREAPILEPPPPEEPAPEEPAPPVKPPPAVPPQEVPCADLRTGLEGGVMPATLSETGLFQDIQTRTLSAGVREFEPVYKLWSDQAEKRRYFQLPEGCKINTGDMDHWVLPVGARMWKDFTVDGKLLETRFIARYGPGPKDFLLGAYAWREDGSDADFVQFGVENAQGTRHNIPAAKSCKSCHSYLPEHTLGFSAIQLNHEGPGATLKMLEAEGRFTTPVPEIQVPGDELTAKALGYLHANCGNCHNPGGVEFNNPFSLRLSVKDKRPEDTGTWKTALLVPVEKFATPKVNQRIVPGDPEGSCVVHRMSIRGSTEQMPPLATKIVDPEGIELISTWIASLK